MDDFGGCPDAVGAGSLEIIISNGESGSEAGAGAVRTVGKKNIIFFAPKARLPESAKNLLWDP